MNKKIVYLLIIGLVLLERVICASAATQTTIWANGIYSVMINSTSSSTNGPIISIGSRQVFRMKFDAEGIIGSCPTNCGFLVSNAYCSNVFIPARYLLGVGSLTEANIGFENCTLAGPCIITFTNSTGYSLLHTFQISADPSTEQTTY